MIGVCFDVDELRGLMTKVMNFPRDTSDFVLLTTAVGACEERSRLAELLHKHLEKRFQLSIRCFSSARSNALGALWREVVASGSVSEARASALCAHAALEDKLAGLQRLIELSAATAQSTGAGGENGQFSAVDRNSAVNVTGKCVLCVGGRSGAVDAYRQVIEQRGGRFLHHDGDLEESCTASTPPSPPPTWSSARPAASPTTPTGG